MSAVAIETDMMRFHLSLNVNDLEKSVHFLTALLGCGPKKFRRDYAKFEPEDLPIVLSLEPRSAPAAPLRNTAGEGSLNHVGIRMTDSTQLVEVQRRIEAAGYTTQREEGVECCYAKQTKFWVHDDDRTMWEVYVLEEDLEHRGGMHEESHTAGEAASPVVLGEFAPRATVLHRLSQEFPEELGAPSSLDEVTLQGSFNAKKHEGKWAGRLAAIAKALKPGGKLIIHTLTANQPVSSLKPLSGPAAVVECVPALSEVLAMLKSAGLGNVVFKKYAPTPCFTQGEIEMRETRLEAVIDESPIARGSVEVLYKGPAETFGPIEGAVLPVGQRVTIPCTTWKRLEEAGMANAFVQFAPTSGIESRCGII